MAKSKTHTSPVSGRQRYNPEDSPSRKRLAKDLAKDLAEKRRNESPVERGMRELKALKKEWDRRQEKKK
jgi:hypothetical protein